MILFLIISFFSKLQFRQNSKRNTRDNWFEWIWIKSWDQKDVITNGSDDRLSIESLSTAICHDKTAEWKTRTTMFSVTIKVITFEIGMKSNCECKYDLLTLIFLVFLTAQRWSRCNLCYDKEDTEIIAFRYPCLSMSKWVYLSWYCMLMYFVVIFNIVAVVIVIILIPNR